VGKTMKTSQNAGKLPTTTIRRITFTPRIFPIHTMSFQKADTFLKKATLSTTRFFRFVKSISELIGILARKLGKTIMNVEISLTALLLKAAVSCTEVRIAQGLFYWKLDNVGFP
jgi:hypothetical protein